MDKENRYISKLDLKHPVHGVVRSFCFQTRRYKDTNHVLRIVDRWKHLYGKAYYSCTTEWDEKFMDYDR